MDEKEFHDFVPKIITVASALKKDFIIIDTRSPKEYTKDHIPKSINIPIFENKERESIGIKYKKDPDEAFNIGKEIFFGKLEEIKKKLSKLDKNKEVVVYCWRGGQRSKAFCYLLEKEGFEVFQLNKGYKAYRTFIRKNLHSLKIPFKLIVLYGLTGVGKTEIIEKIKPSIDLEGLAQHRSSLFGGVGLNPRSQKMFESNLYKKLLELKKEKFVFIEGESHKVGKVFVPNNLFKAMNKGVGVKITDSIEGRVKRSVQIYSKADDKELKKIVLRIKKFLKKQSYEKIIKSIEEKEYYTAAKIILEEYYDPKYSHGLKEKKYDYEIDFEDAIKKLNNIIKTLKNTSTK
jgi:tRNA 2-selenouridine synthase